MNERCPFHKNPIEAANRAAIRNGLGETFNSRYSELFEKFDPEIIDTTDPAINPYDASREGNERIIEGYAMGKYDSYVTVQTEKAPEGTDFHPLKIPVGEYGTDAAEAFAQASIFMAEYIAERPTAPLNAHESMLIREHTYYGVSQKYGSESFLANMQQGIAFTAHGLAALTAEKMRGYKMLPDLLEGLSNQYTTEILTKLVGSLTVTPLVEQGLYVEGALNPDLTISRHMNGYATEARQRHRERVRQARIQAQKIMNEVKYGDIDPDDVDFEEWSLLHQKGALGLSCPAADRGGAVTLAVRSLARLTRKILLE